MPTGVWLPVRLRWDEPCVDEFMAAQEGGVCTGRGVSDLTKSSSEYKNPSS